MQGLMAGLELPRRQLRRRDPTGLPGMWLTFTSTGCRRRPWRPGGAAASARSMSTPGPRHLPAFTGAFVPR
jgi:hypothetical protein